MSDSDTGAPAYLRPMTIGELADWKAVRDPDEDRVGLDDYVDLAALGVDRYCGRQDCGDPASVVVDHPEHGERAVCAYHATVDGYEVIRRVA